MVYRNGKEMQLNRHEFDTLVYLARHPGWVRSKEQIYDAVWTEEVAVSYTHLDVYKRQSSRR